MVVIGEWRIIEIGTDDDIKLKMQFRGKLIIEEFNKEDFDDLDALVDLISDRFELRGAND